MSQDTFGQDEWVAQYQKRAAARNTPFYRAVDYISGLSIWTQLTLLLLIALSLPVITDNNYYIRVGGTIALTATLALGLHVVVGYTGMLDLGFVAFYGIGAYAYAYLSSEFTGIHLATLISIPLIVVISAFAGLLLGLPSLRLVGDYLAIVTLGFGQMFVQLAISLTRVKLPGKEETVDLTGGNSGIIRLDSLNVFGLEAKTVTDHYLILIAILILAIIFVYHLNQSRIGRAWRSVREDELAADAMGMPTRRLKLLAFATGAGIAGFSGAMFAAWQGAVFPSNFDVVLLIVIYAIVVLGGLGSLPGVLIGTVIMVAVPEVLRNVELSSYLFYGGILVLILTLLKPTSHAIILLVAVIVLGLLVGVVANAIWSDHLLKDPDTGSALNDLVQRWLIIPDTSSKVAANLGYAGLVALVLVTLRLRQPMVRLIFLVPTLYLLVFEWETQLSQQPSVTRLLFIGILLITLMIYRPQGIFGQKRVEVM